eukprot:TRINITY_DN31868_c0_g1_i1.p1 TRINITY_DN31868_c0_g1~~TRINITY_DN31868_c0_g1_i1.p1  ORF type:complete len:265 (+),score=59.57 TRINITY_DN31868_c0_g1_i1:97-891(+)
MLRSLVGSEMCIRDSQQTAYLRERLSAHEWRVFFERIDADGDGVITEEEFVAYYVEAAAATADNAKDVSNAVMATELEASIDAPGLRAELHATKQALDLSMASAEALAGSKAELENEVKCLKEQVRGTPLMASDLSCEGRKDQSQLELQKESTRVQEVQDKLDTALSTIKHLESSVTLALSPSRSHTSEIDLEAQAAPDDTTKAVAPSLRSRLRIVRQQAKNVMCHPRFGAPQGLWTYLLAMHVLMYYTLHSCVPCMPPQGSHE